MNEQAIVERIISDAEEEARSVIKDAEDKAADTVAEASRRAERVKIGTEAEVKAKADAIFDGKAATARLDSAKILLSEKRGVIDEIYSRALKQLTELGKAETLHLTAHLLTVYAEQNDEIVFAENFRFVQEASALPVITEKHLKVSASRADIDGGLILNGAKSDKNLSYGAILAADREEHQAEIAAKIFLN